MSEDEIGGFVFIFRKLLPIVMYEYISEAISKVDIITNFLNFTVFKKRQKDFLAPS